MSGFASPVMIVVRINECPGNQPVKVLDIYFRRGGYRVWTRG
jgi:hypothetical protein